MRDSLTTTMGRKKKVKKSGSDWPISKVQKRRHKTFSATK
jgi:hypothetical protein